MKSFPLKQSYWYLWLLALCLSLSTTGCVLPLCQQAKLTTQERQLRGIWNALQHIQDKKTLEIWVSRFLDHLLAGTPYQLKSQGGSFVVVDPTHQDRLCRVPTIHQQQQLRDVQFLTRLYQIHQTHQLSLRNYLYQPPQEFVVRNQQAQTTGGNCQSRQYHIDWVYWKSISTSHNPTHQQEACTLGKQLQQWELCFSPEFRNIFIQRMKKLCR